ncbi:uncharacterized protein EV422DRAFT_544278 [Fimicolochytrium jonesii]|uniref:uncharacterized protein n=1 Tax=Fimicolochytrium jonesii TaxID=1396493 RepID=UPI0022FF1044|nr:uncharacterized protein EV422DRAFT_544278 [Fimicolochytrium jonesii]KAI8816866.1 hypothetical protein EV422DRAFT_544278 [Fimicolochytrium jonesii]
MATGNQAEARIVMPSAVDACIDAILAVCAAWKIATTEEAHRTGAAVTMHMKGNQREISDLFDHIRGMCPSATMKLSPIKPLESGPPKYSSLDVATPQSTSTSMLLSSTSSTSMGSPSRTIDWTQQRARASTSGMERSSRLSTIDHPSRQACMEPSPVHGTFTKTFSAPASTSVTSSAADLSFSSLRVFKSEEELGMCDVINMADYTAYGLPAGCLTPQQQLELIRMNNECRKRIMTMEIERTRLQVTLEQARLDHEYRMALLPERSEPSVNSSV